MRRSVNPIPNPDPNPAGMRWALFLRTPSRAPSRTPPACAKRATYSDPPPVFTTCRSGLAVRTGLASLAGPFLVKHHDDFRTSEFVSKWVI